MSKLLTSLLFALASVSASASPDTTFKEWIESGVDRYVDPDLPPPEFTEGILGGNFYIVDPSAPVEFTFVTSHAGHTLELWVASGSYTTDVDAYSWQKIFTKEGNSVKATNYSIDPRFNTYSATESEIIFRIYDVTTKEYYYSGAASNNAGSDEPGRAVAHAVSFYDYYGGQTLVGFEDLINGGDMDFDDIVFLVSNVRQTPMTTVPEPGTHAMLLAGLGILGAVARRRNKMR
jgi:hypothetical protein